ncbi:MAG: hypothetical protein EP345_04550 [Sphingomonadales bacterium]|nr:MAG: hypothetical protein EP345_04550 [Sphingomonadales bacterium]
MQLADHLSQGKGHAEAEGEMGEGDSPANKREQKPRAILLAMALRSGTKKGAPGARPAHGGFMDALTQVNGP